MKKYTVAAGIVLIVSILCGCTSAPSKNSEQPHAAQLLIFLHTQCGKAAPLNADRSECENKLLMAGGYASNLVCPEEAKPFSDPSYNAWSHVAAVYEKAFGENASEFDRKVFGDESYSSFAEALLKARRLG